MTPRIPAPASLRRPGPLLRAWLALLLPWLPLNSRGSEHGPNPPPATHHWAWQPLAHPFPPSMIPAEGANAVDAFLNSQLKHHGLQPMHTVSKGRWLRRACLDLTGLPPDLENLERFLNDNRPDAFAREVDRLLASPQYGERMARIWLDLARFAESEGFKADETRPNAWRYRDYTIRSFNADKPYDQFVQEQIAGDELWPGNLDAAIATGFNRHYPDESNARNLMQRRQEILNDITDTIGSVFLGLTVGCARCHDHKTDPISQSDYYRLQAYFANTAAIDDLPLLPPAELQHHRQSLAAWESATAELRRDIEKLELPHREAIIRDYVEKYPELIQVALRKPATERSAFEAQMVAKARLYIDPSSHQYIADSATVARRMKTPERDQWDQLQRKLREFSRIHPGPLPLGTIVADLGSVPPETHLLARGNWDSPRDLVEPGLPQIIATCLEPQPTPPRPTPSSTGRRSALALALTDARNPLAARVMVNRIWQMHFGRGLVPSSGDFGVQGEPPTHPALLDWLAHDFIRSGWSIKHLHRTLMTSHAYQRASSPGDASTESPCTPQDDIHRHLVLQDPQNRLLGRFPRQRLDGEWIRDAALAASGRLNPAMGGPGIFPELPPGMESRGGWPVSKTPAERDRRSVYVFVRRNTRYPMFETFDMPDTHESCPRRHVTTSPLQALALLNSSLSLDWSSSLAARVKNLAGPHPDPQIRTAWKLVFSREPQPDEHRLALDFLERQARMIHSRPPPAAPGDTSPPRADSTPSAQDTALVDLCHALLNSNEFVYRN